MWKLQVPYLARHFRVIVFDPRGNGRSDRVPDPATYDERNTTADALAVLDATRTERAIVVGLCDGEAMVLAADHPERVLGMLAFAPDVRLAPEYDYGVDFEARLDSYEGWERWNRRYLSEDWADYAAFFFGECFPEPHSTRQTEQAIDWASETTGDEYVAYLDGAPYPSGREEAERLAARVECPVLCTWGTEDRIVPRERAERL